MADNELEDAFAMRESLFVSREKARNILYAQQQRTEYILRKRIFETQRARNELEWQLLKVYKILNIFIRIVLLVYYYLFVYIFFFAQIKEELENCQCEILNLEQALREKADAQKLAETRLENRAQRSGMELCCDEPYHGLCEEVNQLRNTRQMLTDKINCAKTTYNSLQQHTNRLDADLQKKQHSLATDIRGLDLRQRLKTEGNLAEPKTQTDRNIALTRMEEQIPKI